MKKRDKNYEYLLRLYFQVSNFLSNTSQQHEPLPEIVVAFCIVVEKIFKIKLYNKNPILVFDMSKMKEDSALVTITRRKELNIETLKFKDITNRYKLVFKNKFSDDEIQVLIDIYNIRNHFIHSYRSDESALSDSENIIKKMGTVWEKISNLAIDLFGSSTIKANKPKKKYSEEELEKVLIEEVKKKIKNKTNDVYVRYTRGVDLLNDSPYIADRYGRLAYRERCPRCNSFTFSKENSSDSEFSYGERDLLNLGYSDLYKCKECNLELTKKEYEIAKKIKNP